MKAYTKIIRTLHDNNYSFLREVSDDKIRIEVFSNGDRILLVQSFLDKGGNIEGVEVYKSTTKLNNLDETLKSIEQNN
jgi:hypothetical protein